MSQVTGNKNKKQQKSLQPYQSPHLLIFGTLRDLTAGGSGTSAEPGSTKPPNPNKPPKPEPPKPKNPRP